MTMSRTLEAIRKLPWVNYVDDERVYGNSIIVTLKDGYEFAEHPGCGVQGFDTVADARAGTRKNAITTTSPPS